MTSHETVPFTLRLFYRTGAFHRPDEFTVTPLPPHITLHTWSDCTLTELSHHLAASSPSTLPDPAIGTRLAFRLIYPNRGGAAHPPGSNAMASSSSRFMVKDLGSVVIGDGGKGLDPADVEAEKTLEGASGLKTLADARFIIGDYVSVAILPPLNDGGVAPASDARMGRGTGAGEAMPFLPERAPRFGAQGRERDRVRENGFRGRLGRGARPGIPMGEWRRGEALPDAPVARGRGRWPY